MSDIAERARDIWERLNDASGKYGGVELCAVTKTVDAERINQVWDAGVRTIGENRVQELMDKLPAIRNDYKIHIIGQLQTNKVKYIADKADMIQSLDRMSLAEEISRRCILRPMPVLVEVNIGNEPQKGGVPEAELLTFVKEVSRLPGLTVSGLMTVAPAAEDPEDVRPCFRRMRGWFERLRDMDIPNVKMETLSMGMSGDCLVACQEGATMVRVGSAIFGHRA